MIDLHCHILPGLDDGPPTIEESLAMAEIAVADGITTIIATPHIQGPEPTAAKIREVADTLNLALQEKDIALEIIPAAEVYVMTAPTLLSERTINNSSYVLPVCLHCIVLPGGSGIAVPCQIDSNNFIAVFSP